MDEQIKIKILKYFDHGLQKPFSKNKEERISKTFDKWGPLTKGSTLNQRIGS